jgi:integrase
MNAVAVNRQRVRSKPALTVLKPPAANLADQVEDFIEAKQKTSAARPEARSPRTIRNYRTNLRPFLAWAAAQQPPITTASEVTDEVRGRYRDYLSRVARKANGDKLSVDTVYSYNRDLGIFLKEAVGWAEWQDLRGDFKNVEKKKKDYLDYLKPDEIERMKAKCGPYGDRDRLIIDVLYRTGIRLGELLALRGRDVREDKHLKRFWIHVPDNDERNEADLKRARTKTGRRDVIVSERLWQRLRNLSDDNDLDRPLFVGIRRRSNGNYEPLTPSGVEQMISTRAEQAGVSRKKGHPLGERRINVHFFRHSFASTMANSGAPMNVTQAMLGHKSADMLIKVYAHADKDSTLEALKRAGLA